MKIVQFGKKEDKVDFRKTLFITDTNFIVVDGYVKSLDSNPKEDCNISILNLISIEHNDTYLTINYLTDNQKSKLFCISDLTEVDLGKDRDNEIIKSLNDFYKYIGKTYFNIQTTRKETIVEGLLSSFITIILSVVGLVITYIIWLNPSIIFNRSNGNGRRAAKKNFIFELLGNIVDSLGVNIAGGLFLALSVLGFYLIIKRILNKKEFGVFTK